MSSVKPSVQHEEPCLPESMRVGSIVLLYKDSGDRALVHNYRPITLLNADYKVFAKALALRFGTHLASVVDETQTDTDCLSAWALDCR